MMAKRKCKVCGCVFEKPKSPLGISGGLCMLTKLRGMLLVLLLLVLYLFVSYFDFENQVRQPDPYHVMPDAEKVRGDAEAY